MKIIASGPYLFQRSFQSYIIGQKLSLRTIFIAK